MAVSSTLNFSWMEATTVLLASWAMSVCRVDNVSWYAWKFVRMAIPPLISRRTMLNEKKAIARVAVRLRAGRVPFFLSFIVISILSGYRAETLPGLRTISASKNLEIASNKFNQVIE
jgi:hypothetical protein